MSPITGAVAELLILGVVFLQARTVHRWRPIVLRVLGAATGPRRVVVDVTTPVTKLILTGDVVVELVGVPAGPGAMTVIHLQQDPSGGHRLRLPDVPEVGAIYADMPIKLGANEVTTLWYLADEAGRLRGFWT